MEKKKRPTIAIMAGNTSSEYFAQLIAGFRTCAKEEDVNLVFLMGPYIPKHCKDILQGSFAWNYEYQFHTIYDYVHYIKPDALIIAYGSLSHFPYVPDVDEFVARFKDIPTLLLGDRVKDPSVPYLIGGNYHGMRENVRHLVEDHGYRKIAFVAGPKRNYDSNRRLAAYRDVLCEHGIPIEESMIVYGNYTDAVETEVEYLLDHHPGLEAIVFANDNMAKAGYRVCAARDLVVGHDIAITGFDDGDIAKVLEPSLTSVAHSSFLFSYRAVQLALELCNGEQPHSGELHSFFHKRASCGCQVAIKEITTADSLNELQDIMHQRADTITNELFSTIPYEKDQSVYRQSLDGFFREVIAEVFERNQENISTEQIYRHLKHMCQHPFISKRLLLEYLDAAFFELMQYAAEEKKQMLLTTIMQFTWQYVYGQEINGLQNEIREYERKMWFSPSFTTDLINSKLSMNEQMKYLLGRLRDMGVKSAYLCFFMEAVEYHPEEEFVTPDGKFIAPDELYLTAYFNEQEEVCFAPEDMIVIDRDQQGFARLLPEDKAGFYTCYVLFSGTEQYGLLLAEVEQKDYPFMLTCSMQLGSLRRVINMNIRERKMQQELEEKNRILSMISAYDELSQLLNRRGFSERALHFIQENRGKKACLLFADIDHLKEINDSFGHAAGDFAIQTASEYLRQSMPEDAITARIGGDEYVSLFVAQEEGVAETVCGRIKACADAFNQTSEQPYYIEMSTGVCAFCCDKRTDLKELFQRSDTVLYEQKRHRRESVKK